MRTVLAPTCLALALPLATAASEPRALQDATGAAVSQELLEAVNAARLAAGALPLCASSKLNGASQRQAADMAAGGFIATTGASGSTPTARAQELGFNTTGVWELVGAGYSNASQAVGEWLRTTDNPTYLLGDFEFLGAGFAFNPQQQYKTFWVLDLAKGLGEVCQ